MPDAGNGDVGVFAAEHAEYPFGEFRRVRLCGERLFADRGFNTAILTYRLQPYGRMDALHDIQRAIRLIRSRKEELILGVRQNN